MSVASLDCVTHLSYEGRDLYLVGTAHVSQRSVADVGRVIRDLTPDTVCVELDATRHQALVDPKRWRNLDIFAVIRERRVLFTLSSLVLTSYQRRLGEKLGVRPGAEMLAAIEEAARVGARLLLVDRDIQATLERTWAALSLWDCVQLIGTLIGSLFAGGEITEEQVEALKDRDTISELVREFAEVMPRLQRPLIDERDRFLMSAIREAPGKCVVAVVGAGHVSGMVGYLHTPVDREALSQIPPPSWLRRVGSWVLPVLGLGALASAFFSSAAWSAGWDGGHFETPGQRLRRMLVGLVLIHALSVIAPAALARARWLTLLLAPLASSVLAFLPRADAGRMAAFLEASLRPPTVADREGLSQVASLQDWFQNRFTRVLLVGFAVTIGSKVAAACGVAWLLCVAL
ncbi:MAG TPA: TraB/GumN family protein [Polyangiaceae bacterium]|nr:TraB/GumN family protein [Polyangiaceae bacterium]